MTIYNVMTPIQTDNGKTVWDKVGVAFPNHDSNKKHKMVLSITSLPVKPESPLKLFIFPQPQTNRRGQTHEEPPPPTDDDVAF